MIEWLAWIEFPLVAIACAAVVYMVYRHGHNDGRVQSIEALTRLLIQVYRQQTTINELSAERDMYRNGYDNMSKRVERIGL